MHTLNRPYTVCILSACFASLWLSCTQPHTQIHMCYLCLYPLLSPLSSAIFVGKASPNAAISTGTSVYIPARSHLFASCVVGALQEAGASKSTWQLTTGKTAIGISENRNQSFYEVMRGLSLE